MVNETTDLQDQEGLDGFDADDDATDELTNADLETEHPADEPDPLAEIRQQLGSITQQLGKFADFDPQAMKREIGHVRSLQSKVDSLASADPLKAIDPRVSTTEELLGSLVGALVDSDLLDDTSKNSLRAARERLAQSRTEQEWAKREAALISKVATATQTATETEDEPQRAPSPEVATATAQVLGYAEAKGVDPATIPATAWSLQSGETFAQAIARVKGVVDGLAAGDASAVRTATRRQAAGAGSPSRSGGAALNDKDRYNAYGAGEIEIPEKELRALEARLKAKGEL